MANLADDVTSAISTGGSVTESNFPFFKNYSSNLFNNNPSIMKQGYYLNSNGTLANYGGNVSLSDYIPVVAGDTISCNADPWGSGRYDSNKTFLGTIAWSSGTYAIPNDGTTYIKVAMPDYRKAMIFKNVPTGTPNPYTFHPGEIYKLKPEYGGSRLYGKKWVTEGDSITWGLYSEDPASDGVQNGDKRMPYTRIVAQRLGLVHTNYASSGATLGIIPNASRTDSAIQRYSSYRQDADIITVMSGTNDTVIPLGDITATDTTTFYGSTHTLCVGLINKYPGKKIAFFTMTPRKDNDASLRAKAIMDVCAKHSIPVLDLFHNSGLDPTIDVINNNYYSNSSGVIGSTGDGLHPSYLGHQVIADKVEAFLKTL
jgi:lysophospholipase L1-like esterase